MVLGLAPDGAKGVVGVTATALRTGPFRGRANGKVGVAVLAGFAIQLVAVAVDPIAIAVAGLGVDGLVVVVAVRAAAGDGLKPI